MVAGLLLPIVGLYCDRYGHLTLIMVIASFFNLAANFYWVYLPNTCATEENACIISVFVPIFMMGCSYGFFAGTAWNALVY